MSSEWIAIAGIVGTLVAGIGGGWLQDRRRYRHEAKLRASDSLQEATDNVADALNHLEDKAVALRAAVLSHGANLEQVGPPARETNEAYQRARYAIARLQMRPHADSELVSSARAVGDAFLEVWRVAHQSNALISLPRPRADEAYLRTLVRWRRRRP